MYYKSRKVILHNSNSLDFNVLKQPKIVKKKFVVHLYYYWTASSAFMHLLKAHRWSLSWRTLSPVRFSFFYSLFFHMFISFQGSYEPESALCVSFSLMLAWVVMTSCSFTLCFYPLFLFFSPSYQDTVWDLIIHEFCTIHDTEEIMFSSTSMLFLLFQSCKKIKIKKYS